MNKPVILTGLRANNDLTIANYFGGMLPIIDMAKKHSDEYQINMFIPDLHSFTTDVDHSKLNKQIEETARVFVAAGLPLDNSNIHLYRQSYIPAHSELAWILECFTSFGEMNRMTQFKDKSVHDAAHILSELENEDGNNNEEASADIEDKFTSVYEKYLKKYDKNDQVSIAINEIVIAAMEESNEVKRKYIKTQRQFIAKLEQWLVYNNSSIGLLNYPVLMAADILLYNALYVPVGDDQTQHLEFTRDIGQRMNAKFGDLFTIPKPAKEQHVFFGKEQGLRIKDLADPSKKMSKSDKGGKGVIFLNDDPEIAAKKVMSATTDDKGEIKYDPINQPGISNLLEILALLRSTTVQDIEEEFGGQVRYGDFKTTVADEVKSFLRDFQEKLSNVDDIKVFAKLEQSEKELSIVANETLHRAQVAVGLRRK